jgi:hypothetical protein
MMLSPSPAKIVSPPGKSQNLVVAAQRVERVRTRRPNQRVVARGRNGRHRKAPWVGGHHLLMGLHGRTEHAVVHRDGMQMRLLQQRPHSRFRPSREHEHDCPEVSQRPLLARASMRSSILNYSTAHPASSLHPPSGVWTSVFLNMASKPARKLQKKITAIGRRYRRRDR